MDTKKDLFKTLGNVLITKGVYFVQNAFNVKPEITTGVNLRNVISQRTGITNITLADNNYYYLDLDTIKEILKYDLVDEKEYESEKFDCDDFAQTIYSIFRYVFEINTMGTARGIQMFDIKTGQSVGFHRANVFLAKDNGVLKVFYLEPQNDYIKEITSNEVRGVQGFEDKKLVIGYFDF